MAGTASLLREPRRVRCYVLGVEVLAAAGLVAAALLVAPSPVHWWRFAALAACVVLHNELTRTVELRRDLHVDGRRIHTDIRAVWSFAGTLVLPPVLACALVVLAFGHGWVRILRVDPANLLYRSVFSGATVVCGTLVAALVLRAGLTHYPGIPVTGFPTALADLGVVALAAFVRWAVNYGLVCAAVFIADPELSGRVLFAHLRDQASEIATLSFGLITAVVLQTVPVALAGALAAAVGFNQILMTRQYEHAARVDAKTGLASVHWWREAAQQSLARADADGTPAGMLLFDLDHFKAVNDRHGHIAGDAVLRATAEVLNAETRGRDVCCRWGGEEFAVLLLDVADQAALRTVAERVRTRVETLRVAAPHHPGTAISGLSISAGGALHTPHTDPEALFAAADTALYEAKRQGRNRTVVQ